MAALAEPQSLGAWARAACIWEARAPKAGNVHPGRAFADLTVEDFYRSAEAIGPVFDHAAEGGVGDTVLRAIEATRRVAPSNTNLGIVLLLAPLARVPPAQSLRDGIEAVLANLTIADAGAVFAAIRLARPGGLGQAARQDVRDEPTLPLREVMRLAQDRDLIARQYVDGFRAVLDDGLGALAEGVERFTALEPAILFCQLKLMARHPDSLIARKRGLAEAQQASVRAQAVLAADWPGPHGLDAYAALDAWMRADGNARNPGTTADLVAASLFAALREGIIGLSSAFVNDVR